MSPKKWASTRYSCLWVPALATSETTGSSPSTWEAEIPSYTALIPHTLLLNKDGKQFVDITASSGTGDVHKGHAITFADLDRSGNVAIVAETGGAVPGDAHTLRVFKNPGNNNDWINVHLVGVKSNRSGVGAQIKVTVTDDGQAPRSIYRTVGETSSFGSQPMEQHIGLGHNARIVAIDVWWPATNTRQHFTNVGKNQFIEIKEFANDFHKLPRPAFSLGSPTAATANFTRKLFKGRVKSQRHSCNYRLEIQRVGTNSDCVQTLQYYRQWWYVKVGSIAQSVGEAGCGSVGRHTGHVHFGLYCCLTMRRVIAISLMMLFSWTLIAPFFASDADANLPSMLPQAWQTSLHDAHDGAAQRPPEGLHVCLGEVSLFSGRHLCCFFSNRQAGSRGTILRGHRSPSSVGPAH
jgi:hypothetical protein